MNKPSVNRPSQDEQDGLRERPIADQAKQAARDVQDKAREQIEHRVESRKEKAVEATHSVASAIRETGDKLKDVGPLRNVAERAADRIERAADYLEGKSVGDVMREVERVARREPALFLGAAFALGLLGGRLLKSSARGGGGESARQHGDLGYEERYEAYTEMYDEGASGDDGMLSDDALEADANLYARTDDDDNTGSV